MTKLYCLLTTHITILLISTVLTAGAQNLTPVSSSSIVNYTTKNGPNQKAYGDTLFYEDFSDSTLSNWTVVDLSNKGYHWIWANSAPGGFYSMNIPALNSYSSANGFISLPSDFYNTPSPSGPAPPNPGDSMRAYITSAPIVINPSPQVELVFQQFERDCCYNLRPSIGLSIDGINWQSLPSTNGRGQNAISSNPEQILFDVSFLFANEDTVYLRFYQDGNTHYFWMIDDVLLREPLSTSVLENRDRSAELSLFPNPTNGLVNIKGDFEFDQLEVRDLNGRLVHRQDWKNNDPSLDLSFLEEGLYFLRLSGKEERVEKIVIQH